jgi:hypothetical protein
MAGGVVGNDAQHFRAKVLDQFLCEYGANTLHEAAGQVPFDTLARRWRDGFQDLRLELEAMLLIPDPPPFGGQPFAGTDGRQGAQDRHQVALATNLHPEHSKAALFIEECDPFHKTGDLF